MPDRGGIKVRVQGQEARFYRGTWTSASGRLQDLLQQATDVRGYESLPSDPAGEFHVLEILRTGGELVKIEPAEGGVKDRVY